MESDCLVRKIRQEEIAEALRLVWDVFLEFESPDYTKEGEEKYYKRKLPFKTLLVWRVHSGKTCRNNCDSERGNSHRAVFCGRKISQAGNRKADVRVRTEHEQFRKNDGEFFAVCCARLSQARILRHGHGTGCERIALHADGNEIA